MKIAIFFLIVGLSSTSVAAHYVPRYGSSALKSCPGTILPHQGETLCTMVIMLLKKYVQLKKEGLQNSPKKICLLEMICSILKIVAGYKQCALEIIVNEVMDCLDIDQGKKIILKQAFMKDDPSLAASVNAETDVLVSALICSAQKFVFSDGLDFNSLLRGVLPYMTVFLGSLIYPVTHILGSLLHTVFDLVDGLLDPVNVLVGGLGDTLTGILGSVGGGGSSRVYYDYY